jgi:hypothetical protein
MEVSVIPPSLPHLISGMKNNLLAHLYSRNYKIKLESGKKPHLLKSHIYMHKQKAK